LAPPAIHSDASQAKRGDHAKRSELHDPRMSGNAEAKEAKTLEPSQNDK